MESNTLSTTLTSTLDKVKTAWNDFDLNKWSNEVGGSSPVAEAIQAGIYFCISFGIGYILKKHFKTIVLSLLLSALIVKGMEYGKLLTIDWNAIKNMFGASSADSKDFMTPMVNHGIEWIKKNVIVSIASLIGFLLGSRLG